MEIVTIIARILLGLIFVVFGLNGWFHFIPLPPREGRAAEFLGTMAATGYFNVILVLQVVGGLLLLIGISVPLGLTLLGLVIVNIIMFHLFMDRKGIGLALFILILSLFLLWQYRASFAGLVQNPS
jgi:putative oxidoreductase